MAISTRYVFLAIVVIFAARWYQKNQDIQLRMSTDALPSRIQLFLTAHNLTQVIDGNLAAIGYGNTTRPGLHPDAPKKRHPIVIVPGLTSCGLEVWKAHPCLGDEFFRLRIWGDVSMAQAILNNWTCWLHHIALDPRTGLDREGVRVRAATGLKSADYFVGSYWLWARAIQNFADIGYDEKDIFLACYDWRVAFPLLEERDGYFSGMQLDIERLVARGEKAVVLSHSMGSNVWFYFISWVESKSPGWVDRNIESWANIAGSMLGAMGPLAAFLSGEMDATAALGPFGPLMESFALTFDAMRDIYWSMGGLGAILPMGGTTVWGSEATGWTDTPADVITFDSSLNASDLKGDLDNIYAKVQEKKDKMLLSQFPSWTSYSRELQRPDPNRSDPRRFGNPLATALPNAPNMKIFCLYGVDQPTERAYRYGLRQVRWSFADSVLMPETRFLHWSGSRPIEDTIKSLEGYLSDLAVAKRPVRIDNGGSEKDFESIPKAIAGLEKLLNQPDPHLQDWMRIVTGHHSNSTEDPWENGVDGKYAYGVAKTDGDSTVPLVSLGYMCTNGWRDFKEFNPAGIKVYTKEFRHEPSRMVSDTRGLPGTANHVDVIGNTELITDVLKIVAGETQDLEQDRVFSNITRIGAVISERVRKALDADA